MEGVPKVVEADLNGQLDSQVDQTPGKTYSNFLGTDPRLSIDTVIKPTSDYDISDHEHSMPDSPNVTSEEESIPGDPMESDDEIGMETDGDHGLDVEPLRKTMHSRIENREEDSE